MRAGCGPSSSRDLDGYGAETAVLIDIWYSLLFGFQIIVCKNYTCRVDIKVFIVLYYNDVFIAHFIEAACTMPELTHLGQYIARYYLTNEFKIAAFVIASSLATLCIALVEHLFTCRNLW